MDEETEKKIRLKVFRCSVRISWLQITILDRALDLYSKSSKRYEQDAIMLKEEIMKNTKLKFKDLDIEEI